MEGCIEGGEGHPDGRREQPQAFQIGSTIPSPVEGASLHPSVHQNEDLTNHVSSHPPHLLIDWNYMVSDLGTSPWLEDGVHEWCYFALHQPIGMPHI